MIEKNIEKLLVKEVEKAGGLALKFSVPGKAGYPDRLILMPGGQVMFVETKAPGKKTRPLQDKRLKDLQKMMFKTAVVDSKETIARIAEVVRWQATSYRMTTKSIQ